MQPFRKAPVIPSSSPAFATPARPYNDAPIPTVLPVDLPPATLRPIAFRVLTKKYGLTFTASALQKLTVFIGRHCGNKWREGLAEGVLGYIGQRCKETGRIIIDGPDDQEYLPSIFKELAPRMRGGRIATEANKIDGTSIPVRGAVSLSAKEQSNLDPRAHIKVINAREQPRLVYNVGKKHFDKVPGKPSLFPNPQSKTQLFRNRYNLIHQRLMRNEAFQQPTLSHQPPSLQRSSSSSLTQQRTHKLTPIANLLGRSGTSHLILGLLTISPTGTLALSDLTGGIALDLTHAQVSPPDAAWFVPGMMVLVDGIYEDEDLNTGNLGGGGGVGGTIGGRIIGTLVGTPLAEKRHVTLGTKGDAESENGSAIQGGGFGWVDFLGLGSEREKGEIMRDLMGRIYMPPPSIPVRLNQALSVADRALGARSSIAPSSPIRSSSALLSSSRAGTPDEPPATPPAARSKIAILGNLTLDNPSTLLALTKILSTYAAMPLHELPLSFALMGPFSSLPAMTLTQTSSIEYKDLFNSLAAILSQFPDLLANCTFVFVPGDNDAWGSSFSAGAAGVLPLAPVPKIFTSRINRAFVSANSEAKKEAGANAARVDGEAIWTSNPARLTMFGPTHEMVLFRDDILGRFRRAAIKTAPPPETDDFDPMADDEGMPPPARPEEDPLTHAARKLTKTLLDQGNLSPFRLQDRPLLWDYAESLQLYPLPTVLVICDGEAGIWQMRYEGCTVINPGSVHRESGVGGRRTAGWAVWDVVKKEAKVEEVGW